MTTDDEFSRCSSEIIRKSLLRLCGEIATARPDVPAFAYATGALSVAVHYLDQCDAAERHAAGDAFILLLGRQLGEKPPVN